MKKQIIICMGSSCFSRGNDRNLETIEEFINQHNLTEEVDLRGSRCEGRCSHGPNIRIEHQVISHMDKGDLLEVLEDQLIKSKGE